MADIQKGRAIVRWFREGKRPTMEMMKRVWLNEWDMEGELLAYISALEAEHEAVEVYVLTVCREMYGGDLPCGICAKEAPKRWRLCQAHQAVGEVE